jgi:hypothetical protein
MLGPTVMISFSISFEPRTTVLSCFWTTFTITRCCCIGSRSYEEEAHTYRRKARADNVTLFVILHLQDLHLGFVRFRLNDHDRTGAVAAL